MPPRLLDLSQGHRFAGRPVEGARARRISLPALPPATGTRWRGGIERERERNGRVRGGGGEKMGRE
jgi:hypothetical protein